MSKKQGHPSSTPGEVERLVDALIQSAQEHAWTNKAGAADWGRADYEAARAEIVAARTALLSYISTAGRPDVAEPDPLRSIAKDAVEILRCAAETVKYLSGDEDDVLLDLADRFEAALSAADATNPQDQE